MSKSMYGTLSDKTVLPQPEPKQVRPRTTPSLPTVSPSRFVNGMYKTGLMAKNSYSPDVNMDKFDAEYEAFIKEMQEKKAARLAAEAAAKAAAEKTEPVDETPAQPEVKPEPVEFTTDYSGPSVEVEDKPDLGPVEVELPKLDEQPAEETAPKKKERKKKADAE